MFFTSCNRGPESIEKDPISLQESKKANDYFNQWYGDYVKRYPETLSKFGDKSAQDQWNNRSEAMKQQEFELAKSALYWLQDSLHYEKLDKKTQISYELFVAERKKFIEDFPFRYYSYPITQRGGSHTGAPNVLINYHKIENVQDAEDYISRVGKFDSLLEQIIVNMDSCRSAGVILPKFVFPKIIESCQNLISGISQADCSGNVLFKDFSGKLQGIELGTLEKKGFTEAMSNALRQNFKPSYEKLISYLQALEVISSTDDGAWKFPHGAEYYAIRLKRMTTTSLNAKEIHTVGLEEVERIHEEMNKIKTSVGFSGTLQDFFEFLRTDDQFYYPNTDEGKKAYMDSATAIIDHMKSRLSELFITKPKIGMIVKRVEAYREESAGKAFYYRPALDGSRPGIYYANLKNSRNMPKYEMEALAYHEGIPGHHMQLAINQELTGLPEFRKHIQATAFTEGWGLYSELIPKEIGLYQNPYSDYGRLAMELWRACRLVVDTGIHSERWTRDEALKYYMENTSGSVRECQRMVDRHIVWPGQATAYKVGMMKILELREIAKQQLGEKFDIREFHDVVITNGIIPLDLLERLVTEWVNSKSS